MEQRPQKSADSMNPCLHHAPIQSDKHHGIDLGGQDACWCSKLTLRQLVVQLLWATQVYLESHLYTPFNHKERQNSDRQNAQPFFSHFNIVRRMFFVAVHLAKDDVGPHL